MCTYALRRPPVDDIAVKSTLQLTNEFKYHFCLTTTFKTFTNVTQTSWFWLSVHLAVSAGPSSVCGHSVASHNQRILPQLVSHMKLVAGPLLFAECCHSIRNRIRAAKRSVFSGNFPVSWHGRPQGRQGIEAYMNPGIRKMMTSWPCIRRSKNCRKIHDDMCNFGFAPLWKNFLTA